MSVGKPYVERAVEGEKDPLRFRKLTPYDRAKIVEQDRQRRREQFRADLKAEGAKPGDIVASLREFDERDERIDQYLRMFNSKRGQADIIELSIQDISFPKPGEPEWAMKPEAEKLREYVAAFPDDGLQLAADVGGIRLGPGEEEVADDLEGTPDPNSLTGPTTNPA